MLTEFHASLSPEERLTVEEDLTLVASISTKHAPDILTALLAKHKLPEITEIECISEHDLVLYHFIHNRTVFDEALFFHTFYTSKSYMLYEAKEVDEATIDMSTTELKKEFTRLANKENNATELDLDLALLDGIAYLVATFDGASVLGTKRDNSDGKATTTRKKEEIRIAYLPSDKEVLIASTLSKQEKLIFLDTFLRIVCKSGYEAKIENFDLTAFNKENFDFASLNKGTPLLTWKIKAMTLAFGVNEKAKKKMRLTFNSSKLEYGMSPCMSTLTEIGIENKLKEYTVENVALSFSFTHKKKSDKSVQVGCTISKNKSSLCPLFPYDRYARTLLKQAGIEKGFVLQEKKEKEDVGKKWEV